VKFPPGRVYLIQVNIDLPTPNSKCGILKMIQEIKLMLQCAQNASKILASRQKFSIMEKSNKELVTNHDIAINKMAILAIRSQFPADAVIGEEASYLNTQNPDRLWLIDPIDGTRSFIEGVPGFTFMISLIVNHEPVAALARNLTSKETCLAQKANGIKFLCYDQFIKKNPPPTILNNMIWNDYSSNRLKNFLYRTFDADGIVSAESWGQRTIEFINGNGRFFISLPGSSKIWDTAFASLAAIETGGTITDLKGNKLVYDPMNTINENGAVCSIKMDHSHLLAVINTFLDTQNNKVQDG